MSAEIDHTSRRRKIVIVAGIAAFMAFLDATIVNVAFPNVRDHFPESSNASLSWILNAYNIIFAAFLVPSGRLADRWGRKQTFLAGMILFTVGSTACALAPSVALLSVARAAQALGAAAMVPCAQALLIAAYPRKQMGSAVAIFGATAAFAAGVGPALGGVLVNVMDWRLVFLINIPVGILAAILIQLWVPSASENVSKDQGTPDVFGAGLVTASIGLLALAVTKAPEWQWISATTLGCLVAAAALGVWLVLRSVRHAVPILDPQLFRHPSFTIGNIATIGFAVAYFGTILANVLFLTEVWRYSVLGAGLAVSAPPAAAVLVARPAGRLYDRFGARAVVAPGTILAAVGTLLYFIMVGPEPAYVAEWLPAALVCGAGFGMIWPSLGTLSVSAIRSSEYGVASGVNNAARQVGGVLGVAISIAVLTDATPLNALDKFGKLWIGYAVVALAAGVVALTTKEASAPELAEGDSIANGGLGTAATRGSESRGTAS